ncbi:MAG: ATP-binding protein [Deltaproteobacteria bacterium]|nr:ATP-binding protein [Deltaproteobacteria bacterium]MBM4322313.1 ATP-binding protein [Deltaproteobacteria bacterium]
MKDIFVANIKNVQKFYSAVEKVNHNLIRVSRMALIFGDPGLGKTETALRYAAGNGATTFIRMRKLMNARWLLRELVREFGDYPARYTEALFNQVVDHLKRKKKTLILDEVDYFTSDSKVTETLRDLHDITGIPVIFIGMSQADKRLKRYPHLWDRFVEIVKFQPLDREDVALIISELSNIPFNEEAVDKVVEVSEGKIRKVLALIHRCEYIGQNNRLKSISAKDIRF